MLNEILSRITKNKQGVEIGGPSTRGETIYKNADSMDNVNFSKTTIWNSNPTDEYNYYNDKKGKNIINDAVNITSIRDDAYDFCFASLCLEHIANPLKAVEEWLRIIKTGGYIILILPEKSECSDHKRDYSDFATLLTQYHNNIGEDDLSTLPDILEKHDLEKDTPSCDIEQFTTRCLDNFNNRCLHHYVYNPELLMEINNFFNCTFVFTVTIGIEIWFIIKKNSK